MKTVLIISGSPRKGGNSDLLCDRFAEGAKEAGNEVEKIFLKDHNINYCLGCGDCIQSHKCVQKDDMAKILEKLVRSDVIVMATPVYFYSMNGQMKTFIDRTAPRYENISSKELYFIVAAADGNKGNMNRTIEGFRAFSSCLTNPIEKGIIYGTGAWNVGDIKGSKAMNEAYDMGKSS
jgi:multimeric flavodoxin WrbA